MSWLKNALKTHNRQDNDNTNIEGEEESRSIVMSYAYHLHMAGGRYHEKSFSSNKELAEYASKIGDLDLAERCYKRAIDDAKYLGRLQDEMNCLWDTTQNVYYVWGRYEESLSNYQSLLKHYDKVNGRGNRARLLNNIAIINKNKGEYEQALKLYNESLEITRKIGDQYMVGRTLNNMAVALIHQGDNGEALSHVLQAYRILQRLDLQPELKGSLEILSYIQEKLGNEAYERLVEKIERQLN
jgi:tetratricopeptide (TPR) repeat protein